MQLSWKSILSCSMGVRHRRHIERTRFCCTSQCSHRTRSLLLNECSHLFFRFEQFELALRWAPNGSPCLLFPLLPTNTIFLPLLHLAQGVRACWLFSGSVTEVFSQLGATERPPLLAELRPKPCCVGLMHDAHLNVPSAVVCADRVAQQELLACAMYQVTVR